jgi:hypothetical protein
LPLGKTYTVVRHWPRVEGAFALIEHWSTLVDGCRGILADPRRRRQPAHVYGSTAKARAGLDPADPQRVGVWLIEESLNTRGEHIVYEYKADTDLTRCHRSMRDYRAQRYHQTRVLRQRQGLCHIFTRGTPAAGKAQLWHFQLVFDYGERSSDLETGADLRRTAATLAGSQRHVLDLQPTVSSWVPAACVEQVLMFHDFPKELGD